MILYAESSAVLSWLLGEPRGDEVRECLERADFVVASDLTLVECDRILHRAERLGELGSDQVGRFRGTLRRAVSKWVLLELDAPIIERAREPFPEEPIRSLDALHLASALDTRASIPETAILTLDDRVRRCGRTLGFQLFPSEDASTSSTG